MATGSFYLRGETIWFRFSYKRGTPPFRKSTGEQIPVNAWDSKKQKVKDKVSTSAFQHKINERLTKILNHFEESVKGENINKLFLEKVWSTIDDKKGIDFVEYATKYVEDCRGRVNPKTKRKYAKSTLTKYGTSLAVLNDFIKDEYYVSFKDLDYDFHQNILNYLENKGLSLNTIAGYIKNIKVFAKEAAKSHPVNSFILGEGFYLPSEDTQSVYVSLEEIKKVQAHHFENERLLNVRNWFIIGCWTGLRVSDWWRVGKLDKDFITIKPEKTKNTSGKSVVIPVLPPVKEIISKYGMPYEITSQNYNNYIKEVFAAVGITYKVYGSKQESIGEDEKGNMIMRKKIGNFPKNELISSHTCRRSFATNAYIMGLDSLTIMQITGHSTEKSFLKYIRVTPKQHAEKFLKKYIEYHEMQG